jgi:hypothetical protein
MIPQQKIKYKETEKRKKPVRNGEISEKTRRKVFFPFAGTYLL